MPDIDATIGGEAANSYLTLEAADLAMDSFPNAVAWSNLDEATRQRALLEATRELDRYKTWVPLSKTQALAFPNAKDEAGILRRELVNAFLEFLDWKASGEMKALKKLQAEGVTSRSVLGQNSTFKADPSGLPAPVRNELDKLVRLYSAPVMNIKKHSQTFVEGESDSSLFLPERTQNPNDAGAFGEV